MLSVLIIDDDADAAEQAKEAIIEELDGEVQCRICTDFGDAKKLIVQYRPDIIILDLLHGPVAESKTPGLDIREFIWKDHFCPYIVWSAETWRHDDHNQPHPFAQSVQKERDAERKLPQKIQDMRPYVETLKEIDNYIKRQLSVAMQDVFPDIEDAIPVKEERVDAIRRISRRRLAALIDEQQSDDDVLAAWEMYVCPPVSGNLMLGDIVKAADGDSTDPNSFFIILTPSCDLVGTESRKAKVSDVLVAQCVPTRDGLDRTDLKNLLLGKVKVGKLKDRLKGQFLSPGHLNGIIPLPEYSGKIPTMAADVRKLRLIPIEDVRKDQKCDRVMSTDSPDQTQPGAGQVQKYDRVASIDSPFRELISWAYMQTACRPGMPERDYDTWAKELAGDVDSSKNVQ